MSDSHIRIWSQGGFQDLDANAVTNTDNVAQQPVLRQRVEIPGTITITGNITANVNNVTITALGPAFPTVTVSGNLTATVNNVSVTNLVTVTQGTSPWVVTYTSGGSTGLTTVTGLGASFPAVTITGSVPATLTSLTATPTLFVPVTFTNPTVAITGTPTVTFSQGTQVVSGTATLLGLGPSFPAVTITGSITAVVNNVSVTNVVTVTGFPATQQVSQSFGTLLVSASQGTNPWTVTWTAPSFFPVGVTLSSQWPATTTFLPVTFSNPTVAITGTPTVTFSQGTQVVSGTTTILGLGPNFPTITTTGGSGGSSNVTVTNWTYANPVTVTGNLTATVNNVSVTNVVSVTQNTTPWSVTWTGTVINVVNATISSQWASGQTFLPVTFSNPTVGITGTPLVTFSNGTQVVTGTMTVLQGTNPWVTSGGSGASNVTISQFLATQAVSISGTIPTTVTNLAATTTFFLPVTFTGVAISGTPSVTFSNGTQVVTYTNGTQVVTYSNGTQMVSFSEGTRTVTFSAMTSGGAATVVGTNLSVASPTGASLQVVRSLQELLEPNNAVVSFTVASFTVAAGVAGQRIWVTGYHIVTNAASNVTWIDGGTTPGGLTGTMPLAANSGIAAYGSIDSPVMRVVTPGNALKLMQSTTASIGGVVTYYQF